MAKIVKEVILVEDLIKAINNLPNCPNGHSDVYDKNRIMYMLKTTPSQYVEVDVEEEPIKENIFKIGDYVYADDWCYGQIVEIANGLAYVEFDTGTGGGTLPFDFNELVFDKSGDEV